jgi:hypothetical protein
MIEMQCYQEVWEIVRQLNHRGTEAEEEVEAAK